jgi:hypothetical protein
MNVINFNDKACEKIQRYFDSYVDNELQVETNHEVLQHLAVCATCKRILDSRIRLKQAVKHAVNQEEVPTVLLESVQRTIRGTGRRSFVPELRRWPLLAAAALVLAFGTVMALRISIFFDPFATRGRDAFQLISAQAQEIMRVGLVDHVHCTLLSKKWKQTLTFESMQQATGRDALGPEFIGLVSLVKERLGSNFRIVQGHRCFVNGRQYVHLILTGATGEILSLVITEKTGEGFAHANIAPSVEASGVKLYKTAQGQLQIAGFETNRYLAYVISNLDQNGNLSVTANLAAPVSNFLRRLEI